MRKFLILFIAITLCGSSLLFSATREEAIDYYESKYGDWLDIVIRKRAELLPGDLMPKAPATPKEIGDMYELGLLDTTTEIQLCNFDPISVRWEDYNYIQEILSKISDENERWEEEAKIASALSFSRNFGLPFRCALENQEEIAEAYSKVRYQPTPTTSRKIADNIRAAFDDDYVTTEEKAKQAAITREEFDAYIEYLKDNYFELDI